MQARSLAGRERKTAVVIDTGVSRKAEGGGDSPRQEELLGEIHAGYALRNGAEQI